MRRLAIVAILLTGIFSFSIASAAELEETKMIPFPLNENGGWIGADFSDFFPPAASSLMAENVTTDMTLDPKKFVLCESAVDANCKIPNYYFNVLSFFSPCDGKIDSNCIESLQATLPSGKVVEGTPGKSWNPEGAFKGNSEWGIPDGGSANTWTIPGTNPLSNDQYALIAGVKSNMPVPISKLDGALQDYEKFVPRPFIFLQPVNIVSGKYDDPKMKLVPFGKSGVNVGGGVSFQQGCIINDTTECALRASFPLDLTYSVKVRFSRPIDSWYRGRISEPSMNFETKGKDKYLLTVSGKAMVTPDVQGFIKWSDAPDYIKKSYPMGTGGTVSTPDGFTTGDITKRVLRVGMGSSGDNALSEFKRWIPLLGDKPFAMKSYWNLQPIFDWPSEKIRSCSKDRFSGLVTSNSTVFSAGAPRWNQKDQTLDYTVGAPHYDTEGREFAGQYTLIMKSEVARCLYGFSSAPVSAKVEIASEGDVPNIATTTLTENKSTGFLTLSALGFHYSVPQVKVKFSQASKKVVTNCIRGKEKLTVKGTRCPSGYKKVS